MTAKEPMATIKISKDLRTRLNLLRKLRKNGETQSALIGNLVDAEIAKLGYKYKGTAIGING